MDAAKTRWIVIVLGLGALLGWLLPDYRFNGDGVAYAGWLRYPSPEHLTHVHHLLYLPLGQLLLRIASGLGLTDDPYVVLTALSRGGLVVLLALLPRVLRRAGVATAWIPALWLSVALGNGWREWSTIAGTYVPSAACLLGLFDTALRWRTEGLTRPLVLQAALWLTFAVGFHQLALFVLPGLLVYAWLLVPTTERMRRTFGLALALGLPIALLYGIAFLLLPESVRSVGFLTWIAGYGGDNKYWVWNHPHWNASGILTFIAPALILSHLKVLLAIPQADLWLQLLRDSGTGDALSRLTLGLLVIIVLGGGYALALRLRVWWQSTREEPAIRDLAVLAIGWMLPILLLSVVFEPQHEFYRLLYWIPLLIGFTITWTRWQQPPLWIWIALSLLFAINLTQRWLPDARPSSNSTLVALHALQRVDGPAAFPLEPPRTAPTVELAVLRRYAWCWLERPVYRIHAVPLTQYAESKYREIPLSARLDDATTRAQFADGFWLPEVTYDALIAEVDSAPLWRCFRGQPGAGWPEEAFLYARDWRVAGKRQCGNWRFVHLVRR